jgi:hypothetical protein
MKILILLILILLQIIGIVSQRPPTKEDEFFKYRTRFRAVKCESVDNSTAYWNFCFIKAHNRYLTSLNFGWMMVKPFTKWYLRVQADYRYGNIYREIVDTKSMDFCPIMAKSGSGFNLFFKLIFDLIKASVPSLFHKCPYVERQDFYNITIDDELAKKTTIFPEGQYKYNISFCRNIERADLTLIVFSEIRSPLKSSFG